MNVFLWVIVPYVCLAVFAVGHWWRYRYDKFGWTTRSSQLYESRLLRLGSPLFHFGMLGVVGGHIFGLLVPQSWTDAIGIRRIPCQSNCSTNFTSSRSISCISSISVWIKCSGTTSPVSASYNICI